MKTFFIYEKPTDEDKESKSYDKEGYITLDFLQKVLPSKQADFYFCGPEPFMRAVNRALKQWEIPEERIHYEFFGSFGNLEDFIIGMRENSYGVNRGKRKCFSKRYIDG